MTRHEQVLNIYGSVADKTGQMLDAARSGDWDRLVELEKDCRTLIETLRNVDDPAAHADADYVQRKAEMIRKVLADDVEIRKHTEPWMDKLQVILGSARQMRNLERTYGTSDSG